MNAILITFYHFCKNTSLLFTNLLVTIIVLFAKKKVVFENVDIKIKGRSRTLTSINLLLSIFSWG